MIMIMMIMIINEIMITSNDANPQAAGSMLGAGLYFAESCMKSDEYGKALEQVNRKYDKS